MRKVLVLGAGGMLGHKLCQRLSLSGWDVVGTVRQSSATYTPFEEVFAGVRLRDNVDVMDMVAVRELFAKEKPYAVINCVGVIKQHEAANDRRLAVGLNSYLPHVLARSCDIIGARLVNFSTDCVFSGRKGQYREADNSDAEDVYGRTKYLGETDEGEGNAVTLRTSIIGRELRSPTHGLIDWFLSQKGKSIRGFAGAIYTGFTTIEISRIVELILEAEEPPKGVYQVASAAISKFDLLKLVAEIGHFDVEITRDETFCCDRSLIMDRFSRDMGYRAPLWPGMIREMLSDQTPYDAYQRDEHA